jgi:peptidoglycan/LPS O-acetylase OafA/YrhL
MLVSVPFAWIYLIPNHFKDFSNSILYSLGFNSNYYFWRSGQIYGAVDGTLKPFLHTWSLSVEEQFYILFPITIFIVFKYFRKYLIYLLFAGLITSFILAEWIGRYYPHFSFYILPTRAWELIAGSILAHLELNNNRISKNQILMRVMPCVGILMILFSIFIISDKLRNPSIHTLLPILGVSLIIWFSNKDELITKILSTKLFIGIGLISYSLYLWHYPIFAFGKIIDLTSSIFSNFELISLTVFLSILSYFFIEKPARNKKNKFKKVFLFLLSVILILVPINLAVVYYDGVKIDSRVHPLLWKYYDERANFVKNYNFNNFDHRENVLIIGNSYAEDLLNVLSRNKNLKKKYYFYVAKSKEFREIYQLRCFYDFLSKNDLSCRKEDFTFLIEQYKKSNYIILHVRRSWHYQTDWFQGLIDLLRKDKKEFIILLDDVSYADVLDIHLKINNKVPDKQELTELEKVFFRHAKSWDRQSLDKARKVLIENDLKFLGRSEIYCDYNERKCPLLIDGDKLYLDEGHLTNHGAKYFSTRVEKLINQLID